MSIPKVVIVSAPDDLHAEAVSNILKQRELGDPVILDLAMLPSEIAIYTYNDTCLFAGSNLEIDLSRVQSIWWRRPQRYRIPKEISSDHLINFCQVNTQQAVEAMLVNSGKLIVNDPFSTRKADHKLYQLSMARKCDLQIPETVVTTDPIKAQAFIDYLWSSGRQVVVKCIQSASGHYAPTRLLAQNDLSLLHTIKYAPAILQERIAGAIELRITIVGNDIYSASCKSFKEEAQVDIRLDSCQDISAYMLPEAIQGRLLKLMKHLQLTYAAVDMFFKPPNQYFFLEINPSGQYLYIEIPTLLPISASIAEVLSA